MVNFFLKKKLLELYKSCQRSLSFKKNMYSLMLKNTCHFISLICKNLLQINLELISILSRDSYLFIYLLLLLLLFLLNSLIIVCVYIYIYIYILFVCFPWEMTNRKYERKYTSNVNKHSRHGARNLIAHPSQVRAFLVASLNFTQQNN
jgi:ABC-type multidrug transport system fused ATPase/permease subunit